MSRHAERYPTTNAGLRMTAVLDRVREANATMKGDLSFVNTWQWFGTNPSKQLDQLITTGPYAGTLQAFSTGVKLRSRYAHLLTENRTTRIFACDTKRVIDTAAYFTSGLFGLDYASSGAAELVVIPETSDLGGDTLTPGDTCLAYQEDKVLGHDYGAAQLASFRATYLPAIRERLLEQNPSVEFTDAELYAMQEMCGFETLVRGTSPWCGVFSHAEWDAFEYARDVIHYYRAGPGNQYGPAMGWLWLNATATLMGAKEPEMVGKFFASFVHDGDVVPMLSALGVYGEEVGEDRLPVHQGIKKDRIWKTSQVTPMGGRVIFERLGCGEDVYVRLNINDGIVALPGCSSGPGSSCPFEEFLRHVKRREKEVGDFREVCGLPKSAADRITFMWQ
jgi:acid phosphatase